MSKVPYMPGDAGKCYQSKRQRLGNMLIKDTQLLVVGLSDLFRFVCKTFFIFFAA